MLMLGTTAALGTERSDTSAVRFVYPPARGDVVLGFDVDRAFCTYGSSPKYQHIARRPERNDERRAGKTLLGLGSSSASHSMMRRRTATSTVSL
jgi:hypothetical protein